MKLFSGIVLALLATGWFGGYWVRSIQFEKNCMGYLKLASDANTIELAKEQLGKAIDYAKSQNWDRGGFTSVIYNEPSEDVGFWFSNLEASLKELEAVPSDASQLTKTNVLMKLRETLLDHESGGDSVTFPPGISTFPNNVAFFWLSIVIFIVGYGGAAVLIIMHSSENW